VSNQQIKPTLRIITLFWLPLAGTWLMMAAEQPVLASLIARLESPTIHLAAFGVAYSVALIFEAPIIMILSAVTALVHDKKSYHQLFMFTLILNGLMSVAIAVACLPTVFSWLSNELLNIPDTIKSYTHISLIILIPWPAAIGFRRFFQGILIVRHKTNRVAMGTIFRFLFMSTTAIFLFSMRVPGAIAGSSALAAGVVMECLATWWMARKAISTIQSLAPKENQVPLSLSSISKFYYPLALTSFLSLGVQPITTFFISKGRYPLESLAVLPVINGLVFIFRSLGLSFQEVAITFIHQTSEATRQIIRFAWFLGIAVFICMTLLALTPLSLLWFEKVSGLNINLASFAIVPTQLLVLLPSLTVLISFQRAVLVTQKATGAITIASLIELCTIVVSIWFFITQLNWIGATAAASAFLLGRLGANAYLWPRVKTCLNY